MRRILCLIGFHDWLDYGAFFWFECARCRKQKFHAKVN